MDDLDQRWVAVGEAIAGRITELQMTKNEVIRASGVSYKSLTGYMEGQPIRRADKARGICEALRWPPDAIERLYRGEPPTDRLMDRSDERRLAQAQVARARVLIGDTATSYTAAVAKAAADEIAATLSQGGQPSISAMLNLVTDLDRVESGQVSMDPDDPDSTPTSRLPQDVTGLAAKAGKLSPEARAKLEGYIDALLDEEGYRDGRRNRS